ncbi:hypothetical protein M427DRAFT_129089 [Gonapodya prolifera JEL478]|uniref:Trafficking protein particle complex subunit n=1 Tax=Gonapodya prolifera (strain JEL478) TaxID=1344416 RepID=A0A138ZY38_GONPJ|nr:hypothetical protein M427DRAFT_129089 [Gonapodya prolifera JEL478]|eukprot:KXS09409.1 hypothetical protein M427DRAFT_129089 [Gonapodya prolifera JEL478]
MIYSIYIFDRHCVCIYHAQWHRHAHGPSAIPQAATSSAPSTPPLSASSSSASRLQPPPQQPSSHRNSDVGAGPGSEPIGGGGAQANGGLAWEEEAKLVYGVIFSLKNICNKLRGSEGGFICYRTSTYKLHHHATPTGIHLVLLSDPSCAPLQSALKDIHAQCYVEHVARNPLARREGEIKNEGFKMAVNRIVRGLAAFESPA